jgi:hypothetical protein
VGTEREADKNKFRVLGFIRDADNVERLYVKETDSQRLIPLRMDGIAEDDAVLLGTDPEAYLVQIGGAQFAIRRNEP